MTAVSRPSSRGRLQNSRACSSRSSSPVSSPFPESIPISLAKHVSVPFHLRRCFPIRTVPAVGRNSTSFAPPASFSEEEEMAVGHLALQPCSTGPNTAMTPQTLTPGQLDHLPPCTPITNIPNIVPTSVTSTPLDRDIVMTPQIPMPGHLPLSTPVTNILNAVPISVTPKSSLEPPNANKSNTMDFDLDSPTPPSRSTSLNLHPPTSGRPLQIPKSFESVIQRTVMERLTLNSTEFVQATVSGVVDTCIPRLVEFIDAKITSFATDRTKGSHTPSGCRNDGWEGDNEDESPSPKGRKKPGPRGHMSHLHVWRILRSAHHH
jgi:hypothetical protein